MRSVGNQQVVPSPLIQKVYKDTKAGHGNAWRRAATFVRLPSLTNGSFRVG